MSRHDSGFILLETLVAFVIAALAVAVLYRAAFDGAAGVAIGGREAAAVERAQSRLAALAAFAPRGHYVRTGQDGGGFSYREEAALLPAAKGAPLRALRLSVSERWGRAGRTVTLVTIRVAPP